jgi:hypothetical protein
MTPHGLIRKVNNVITTVALVILPLFLVGMSVFAAALWVRSAK